MKPVLFAAIAAAALSTAPAFADNGQVFDHAAQLRAYSNVTPRDDAKQCFNGKFISGVNRSGDKTLYVQSTQGIYRLRLTDDCSALNAAEAITVRANGSDLVCPGDGAEAIARTAAGAKHCRVANVHRLTSGEVTTLAAASRR
uniref:Uncharacterized protein n=1 Tax=Caulobacter sp. (strain K31) TaxID=366602 RepID=B0T813_CAUSK